MALNQRRKKSKDKSSLKDSTKVRSSLIPLFGLLTRRPSSKPPHTVRSGGFSLPGILTRKGCNHTSGRVKTVRSGASRKNLEPAALSRHGSGRKKSARSAGINRHHSKNNNSNNKSHKSNSKTRRFGLLTKH